MGLNANSCFVLSAVLFAFGSFSLKWTRTNTHVPFAAMPLILSVQQFAQGWLWLALTQKDESIPGDVSKYIFLVCSQVLWPVWVPFCLRLMERDPKRKRMLNMLCGLGVLTAFALTVRLFFFNIEPRISDEHIVYDFNTAGTFNWLSNAMYFIVCTIPFFVSGIKRMGVIGYLQLASFFTTVIFFGERDVVPVWGYFSLLISMMVVMVIISLPKISNRAFARRRAGTYF
ncbi:MAG TPA: DUF6629 family protein [Bacteroidia bacterium]|jgi:hypothetical protein